MKTIPTLSIITLLALLASPACADKKDQRAWTGRVVSVADGDTVTVLRGKEQVRIRLARVDTPEKHQDFGQVAKKFTLGMVGGKEVRVVPATVDRYGRTVARVYLGKRCLNTELVRAGLAWWYRKYAPKDHELARLEAEARKKGKGLWKQPHPTAPWDWRRQQRGDKKTKAAPAARATSITHGHGPYHGNSRSKALHAPGCRHYNCKNCKVKFKSLEQARAAGYHPHEACVK